MNGLLERARASGNEVAMAVVVGALVVLLVGMAEDPRQDLGGLRENLAVLREQQTRQELELLRLSSRRSLSFDTLNAITADTEEALRSAEGHATRIIERGGASLDDSDLRQMRAALLHEKQRVEELKTGLAEHWNAARQLTHHHDHLQARIGHSETTAELSRALIATLDDCLRSLAGLRHRGHDLERAVKDLRAEARTTESPLRRGLLDFTENSQRVTARRAEVDGLISILGSDCFEPASSRIDSVLGRHIDNARADFDRRLTWIGILIAGLVVWVVTSLFALRRGSRKLHAMNAGLEARVAERTVDLEHAVVEARAASDAKSRFVASVSHEVRTPLTAILGFAEILQTDEIADDERRRAAETISQNGDHLLAILNDVIEFSRLEHGGVVLHPEPLDLRSLLRSILELSRPSVEQSGLSMELEVDPTIPPWVLSDPTRVRQVLLNLCGNAVKFSERGTISVHAYPVGLDQIVVAVHDEGIGIPKDRLEVLTQPFQSDQRTTGSTGLGLATAKRLAHLLSGRLRIQSAEGRGTSVLFSFRAPAHHPPEPEPEAVTRAPQKLEGRVLIVDDGPDNRTLIRKILERSGLIVETCEDGRQAVDRILHSGGPTPDLCLMDLQMPCMDGFEATRRLREGGYSNPILALSAHALDEDRDRVLEAGADDFAGKPIRAKQLVECVRHQLERDENAPDDGRSALAREPREL